MAYGGEDVKFHGGQDWMSTENLITDFSVTTGILGPCEEAVSHLDGNLHKIHHYPSLDQEPCRSQLKSWLGLRHDNLILGNGSSELIDLVIRLAPAGDFAVGPSDVQYKEYETSCKRYGRNQVEPKQARLHVLVNPTNPTGEYFNLTTLTAYLEKNVSNGSYVVIDESMLPWFGPQWKENSIYFQHDWIQKVLADRNIHIIVIHSWTKIFCCTGLRIGSIILPCKSDFELVRKFMVPWNVNILASEYLSVCMKSKTYLQDTWDLTKKLRKDQVAAIAQAFPDWEVWGQDFVSWMWIDTKDEDVAERAVATAKTWGCPIRWGKMGYGRPTFIRLAVRKPEFFSILFNALKQELLQVQ
jgi:histidinol-phosphate/aromatic aminotransferase/cobyric acid decarboxylase-like protein